MAFLTKFIVTLLAMGGILIDRITPLRLLSYLIFIVLTLFYGWLGKNISGEFAIMIFAVNFLIRYLFLFNSFKPNGFAVKMKNRLGEVKGFELYQFITSIMFFLSALNFTLVFSKTSLFNYEQIGDLRLVFAVLGGIGVMTGFLINIWSAMLIGIDIYYYKDLFLGRQISGMVNKGPYKYLSNPLYGLGQLNGYGTALMYGSLAGIIAIVLNQTIMFIFFYKIEKPHIIKCIKDNYLFSNPKVKETA